MNFNEIYEEVQYFVKRPDLQDQVKSTIRAATLKLHQARFWHRSLVEAALVFDTEAYTQSFNPKEVITSFRKPKYFRLWSGVEGEVPTTFFKQCDMENLVDGYGYLKDNIWYLAGTQMQLRSAVAFKYAVFGCYVHPVVLPEASYSSWVAEDYPYSIIHEATRIIFKTIGRDEQAAEQNNLSREQFAVLTSSEGSDETPT